MFHKVNIYPLATVLELRISRERRQSLIMKTMMSVRLTVNKNVKNNLEYFSTHNSIRNSQIFIKTC